MNRILILVALLNNPDYLVGATSRFYKTLTVEDSDLCSLATDRRIVLRESQPALLVKQLRLGEHRLRWKYDMYCHFVVDAQHRGRQFGVYALIQNLNFRYDAVNKKCIDYIKFKSRDGDWTAKICGTRNTIEQVFDDEEDGLSDIGFIAPKGKMDVFIHVDKEALLPSESKTDMSIAFTLFEPHKYSCPPTYSYCGKTNECILSELFGDGIVNCPYELCPDETSCVNMLIPPTDPTLRDCVDCSANDSVSTVHTEVTIATVTTLVLSFALFVTCLWICRKHGKLCWSDDCSNGPPPRTQQSRVMEMENRAAPAAGGAQPSAPVPDADKDLPPSYDSLFPV